MSQSSVCSDSGGTPRKGMYFCPECGYSAPFDGEWDTVETPHRRHIRCPECQTTLLNDRQHREQSFPVALWWEPTVDMVENTVELWGAIITFSCRRYSGQSVTSP